MKIVVVGGGASGMMAALISAKEGAQVTLIEKNEKTGKKLYITGKGRCNLLNLCSKTEFLDNVVTNSKFLFSAIHKFSPEDAYSFFEKMLEEGYSPNKAGLLTLLQYIASIEDTNMMIRSDFDTVQRIQKEMKRFLRTAGPEQQLEIIPALDAYFVKNNISPGGSADMLALTYFLYFLKKKKCPFEAFELDKGGMCHETFE